MNYKASRLLTYDAAVLFPALLLVGIGVVMVYSASSALALKKFGTEYYFLKKQAVFALLGMLALVLNRHIPWRFYRMAAYPLLGIALVSLIAVQTTGWGVTAGGSSRWIRYGEISFQPSEFARFALIVYMAYSIDKKGDRLKDFYVGFLPHVLVLGCLSAFILLQPDFGAAVILGAISWMMMFVGGVRLRHLTASLLLLAPILYLFMMTAEYRIKRLMSFLDPWRFSSNEGYQMIHSMMAFGTGGIWGAGIGSGYQKLFYLPEPHTDFIFAVIGEELGLIGVMFVLGLYAAILWRGIGIARNAEDVFGSLLAFGLTTAIGLQVSVNMGVTLGLLPTKGLALPFLSYGGTSLIINMASIGILMNIGATRSK
jgi:cell division protein FtsW